MGYRTPNARAYRLRLARARLQRLRGQEDEPARGNFANGKEQRWEREVERLLRAPSVAELDALRVEQAEARTLWDALNVIRAGP